MVHAYVLVCNTSLFQKYLKKKKKKKKKIIQQFDNTKLKKIVKIAVSRLFKKFLGNVYGEIDF